MTTTDRANDQATAAAPLDAGRPADPSAAPEIIGLDSPDIERVASATLGPKAKKGKPGKEQNQVRRYVTTGDIAQAIRMGMLDLSRRAGAAGGGRVVAGIGLLWCLARNAVADAGRKNRRTPRAALPAELTSRVPDPAVVAADRDECEAAMRRLSPGDRASAEALAADKTWPEIAGENAATAQQAFRRRMKECGFRKGTGG